jgi:hypothetical protein
MLINISILLFIDIKFNIKKNNKQLLNKWKNNKYQGIQRLLLT